MQLLQHRGGHCGYLHLVIYAELSEVDILSSVGLFMRFIHTPPIDIQC